MFIWGEKGYTCIKSNVCRLGLFHEKDTNTVSKPEKKTTLYEEIPNNFWDKKEWIFYYYFKSHVRKKVMLVLFVLLSLKVLYSIRIPSCTYIAYKIRIYQGVTML